MTTAGIVVAVLAGSALLQDAGRDLRTSGVPQSGAFDRFAHRAATRLVGGGPSDAALELVGRIEVRPTVGVALAATGGVELWIDDAAVPGWTSVWAGAGQLVTVRSAGTAYLAVAGGVRAEAVLGSRSTCLLGPLGPRPVARGDLLAVAEPPAADTVGDWCRVPQRTGPVRVVPGPHLPMAATEVVVADVSRIGVRVRPPRPVPATADLASLGVLPGAIQVMPSGDWIVLGPDSGTMGGYPIAGVVIDADRDRWAQVAVGDRVPLLPIAADEAPAAAEPVIVRVGRVPG